MENIPLEIILYGVLPRLPAKSLKCFNCVSKPWLALISSNEFINDHLHYTLASNTNHLLILTGNDTCLYSCNLDFPKGGTVKLPSFGIEPSVVGSCNGLLCIQSYRPYCLVLLNPSTGSYRELPSLLPSRRCSAMNFGFGFDSKNDDYKVVRIVDRYSSLGFLGYHMDRIVHVYSLKKNSWEVIEWTSPECSMGPSRENGALVNNHLLHWKFWCLLESKYRIRCFDLCEKQWINDVPLPDCMEMGFNTYSDQNSNTQDRLLDLWVFDGRLYLSIKNQKQSAVDIWVMNEYGIKDSWVKLFEISDPRVFESTRVSLIAYQSIKRQILLRIVYKAEHKILWYDIESETVEIAVIGGLNDSLWVDVCKGTLLDVPGGSKIGTTKQMA
ncbi:F-box protein CPR1-like [Amaranthus tricolor]|uniref:F-box protein CPR1-like n=1 Tax=Amaranthus tricolor TaxID=29722 RepID=UPI002586016D|nr:F-box protein CPR1-like [Amaranthus tricolor]XP_057518994.1 F-box protein CPR1-like [Amaranthus tricolor]XP_057518995.1 F-box protein CPR1-like [Amaranthus tricolor]XP_057518996.1 F-box protein CPR1-like [Amaranthus tricolor]XP_057518997.1 F-box protein CPR1-like [Amaranthus tricolor]